MRRGIVVAAEKPQAPRSAFVHQCVHSAFGIERLRSHDHSVPQGEQTCESAASHAPPSARCLARARVSVRHSSAAGSLISATFWPRRPRRTPRPRPRLAGDCAAQIAPRRPSATGQVRPKRDHHPLNARRPQAGRVIWGWSQAQAAGRACGSGTPPKSRFMPPPNGGHS